MSSIRVRSRHKTANLFKRCIRRALARPEELTVSQWAEKHRRLDESSAMPGPWKNYITPYLIGIMDAFNDPYIEHINFVKSTQVGGTEALINATGWIIMENPSPTMIVYPTDDLAKDISNDKLKPAYRLIPEMAEIFKEAKSNEMNLKFRGMNLYLRSGGSPSKLASKAIRYLFFDEIDKMNGASKKEGSPFNLATERTKTFKYSRKIYTCSTPTIKDNYVWRFHETADEQREYFVPCPNCGEYITLRWSDVKFDNGEDMTISARAATAKYFCHACGAEIRNGDKLKMLMNGEWRDVKQVNEGRAHSVSFHINALYSHFVTWEDMAKEFIKSKNDPDALQNFVNSWLGEPWEDINTSLKPEMVFWRQSTEERGIVPDWGLFITAGVDVQRDRVYYDIVAWGRGMTSQSIQHGVVKTLEDLDPIMNTEYYNSLNQSFVVSLALIDSGDQTELVYEFCSIREWAVPCKGDKPGINHYRRTLVNKNGKTYGGMELIMVDGGKYKDMIAARLRVKTGTGSAMVHAECDVEYANQLTAEHKVSEGSGYKKTQVWRPKTVGIDNHYLDCRVYASCAADLRGIRDYPENEPVEIIQESEKKPARKGWLRSY
ncbi:MAG: phage terminase large subunit family protein [bacterium]|nr:phage terminase large subunit family protein [bacterium]